MSQDARTAFATEFDVSRETLAKLDRFAELLTEWQQRMNLVGPSTLPHIWDRHFRDSAQLLAIAGPGRSWLDIGAGGGFPGLVLAILDPESNITLVESITKKCRFLDAVAHETHVAGHVAVANVRVEALAGSKYDIITARAAAGLETLLDWGMRFAGSGTRWILPKGARVQEELASAAKQFHFDHELIPSRTDSDARIVVAKRVKRR
ncbi:16S rRNA (guanine(527)-N(7))-methyltransferase RsmG [Sandarakinorhabdus limnophila]|uniref:16S rRNA (guanine(527)-N(7))-methyltransferase RsmG n=1 Tax=Sandarakinorhabdus limnophila TaxID=210512 RepID=UPI0026EE771F|nr:16S rRNA (guanine(527)-N(7))-methyltransferase RsmG [Sandarakinorhabdus limnophila]